MRLQPISLLFTDMHRSVVNAQDASKKMDKRMAKSTSFPQDSAGRMIFKAPPKRKADDEDMEDSTNAYLDAIKGEDGFSRDAKGRVKANKSRKRDREGSDDRWVDEIEGKLSLAPAEPAAKKRKAGKQQIGAEFKAKVRSPCLFFACKLILSSSCSALAVMLRRMASRRTRMFR